MISRRDFSRLLALSGSVLLPQQLSAWPAPLAQTPPQPDERFWLSVREQFLMPPDLACHERRKSLSVSRAGAGSDVSEHERHGWRSVVRQPAEDERRERGNAALARELPPRDAGRDRHHPQHERSQQHRVERARPEGRRRGRDLCRQPSEQQRGVDAESQAVRVHRDDDCAAEPASGRRLLRRSGDESAITPRTQRARLHASDQHGRRCAAREGIVPARARARRPHAGRRRVSDRLSSMSISATMQPDFYTGSSHKWPCGPKEVGVLYVNARAHDDDPSQHHQCICRRDRHLAYAWKPWDSATSLPSSALAKQSAFRPKSAASDRSTIAIARARLMAGLRRIDGVHIWTHPDPGAVGRGRHVPGQETSTSRSSSAALYKNDRIGCATRTGSDRPGIRLSPHIYNTMAEVDRAVAAIAKYMRQGV